MHMRPYSSSFGSPEPIQEQVNLLKAVAAEQRPSLGEVALGGFFILLAVAWLVAIGILYWYYPFFPLSKLKFENPTLTRWLGATVAEAGLLTMVIAFFIYKRERMKAFQMAVRKPEIMAEAELSAMASQQAFVRMLLWTIPMMLLGSPVALLYAGLMLLKKH